MNLNVFDGIEFINKAIEERDKEQLWEMWLVQYPHMSEEDYIPFDEFYDKATGKNLVQKPKQEILAMAEEIERKIREKRGEIDGS